MKLIIIYCTCVAFVHGSYSWYEVCRRSDPNVDRCILDKIEALRPKPLAEPVFIDRLYADSTMNGVKMKATLENVVAYRGYSLRIEHFKTNLRNQYRYTAEIKVLIPQLYLTADYDFQGSKYFTLTFKTNGKFIGKFDNIAILLYCVASPVIRNRAKYLKLDSVTAKVSMENAKLHLEQADRYWIGQKIVSYARSDPAGAMRKLTPAIEENAARLFKEYIDNLLGKVPLYLLLSD